MNIIILFDTGISKNKTLRFQVIKYDSTSNHTSQNIVLLPRYYFYVAGDVYILCNPPNAAINHPGHKAVIVYLGTQYTEMDDGYCVLIMLVNM